MAFGGTARGLNETMAASDTMRMRSDRHLAMSDRLANGLDINGVDANSLSRSSTRTQSSSNNSTEGQQKKKGLLGNLMSKVSKIVSVVGSVATGGNSTARTETN
jgi:hypothetical protein